LTTLSNALIDISIELGKKRVWLSAELDGTYVFPKMGFYSLENSKELLDEGVLTRILKHHQQVLLNLQIQKPSHIASMEEAEKAAQRICKFIDAHGDHPRVLNKIANMPEIIYDRYMIEMAKNVS
jgi:hypothetical protein